MKEYIRIWVILKRVTYKIRSARSPLIMGRWEWANNWGNWGNLESFLRIGLFGGWSEKGSSRECTENWVTRWTFLFWGNFGVLRWFTKRIYLGEFEIDRFWGFVRWSTWMHWGGGTNSVFGGIYLGELRGGVEWGDLWREMAKNNHKGTHWMLTGELFELRITTKEPIECSLVSYLS
jgi:hypothetical protein